MKNNIRIISAGAGSGKTTRITNELIDAIKNGDVRPDAVIATTFTVKAANELKQRVREELIRCAMTEQSARIRMSAIGTVHSVCLDLIKRFAFAVGITPDPGIIAEGDAERLLHGIVSDVAAGYGDRFHQLVSSFGGNIDVTDDVGKIIGAMRANAIDPKELPAFAERSAETLLKHFPAVAEASAEETDERLLEALHQAIEGLAATGNTQSNTLRYLAEMKSARESITTTKSLPWTKWRWLAAEGPKKKELLVHIEPVKTLASRFESHPRFHADFRELIAMIFDMTAKSATIYAEQKLNLRVVDYNDMERMALDLLDNPEVARRLAEETDLLLVDEFQDTNPTQLAIFLKLTGIVKNAVWVGDPKQCIYAFRGSDPGLMDACLKTLGKPGQGDILDTSYRSRPPLVDFVNAVFVPAFADKLPKEQVVLKAYRPHQDKLGPALRALILEPDENAIFPIGFSDEDAILIATAIKEFIQDKNPILPKGDGEPRPVRPGDIAVLSRTNDQCEAIAVELEKMGIPVTILTERILESYEFRLLHAALRYLVDPRDALAIAELTLLCSDKPDVEALLTDRMAFLKSGEKDETWRAGNPVLAAIRAIAGQSNGLGVAEVVDALISEIDLRRIVCRWPNGGERLARLELARALAGHYEAQTTGFDQAVTVAGFALWLEQITLADIEELSLAAADTDAVRVLTYHKAKGLEWPVVFNTTIGSKEPTLTGMHVEPSPVFDPKAPLADRWIRYWPWPFHKRTKFGLTVKENMAEDPMSQRIFREEQEEGTRLAYVGMTRPRDYLFLEAIELEDEDEEDNENNENNVPQLSVPLGGGILLNITGSGESRTIEVAAVSFPITVTTITTPLPYETSGAATIWPHPPTGRKTHPPARLNPSLLTESKSELTVRDVINLEHRLAIKGEPDRDTLGTALHDFLAAWPHLTCPPEEKLRRLADILARYGLSNTLDAGAFASYCDKFFGFVKNRYTPTRILTEWPLAMRNQDGQDIIGQADLILDTAKGYIVIDHKSFPGGADQWPQQALTHVPQLSAYADIITKATQRQVIAVCAHFHCAGGFVEMGIGGKN